MSKIVEWFLFPLFFIMSVLYAFNSLTHERIQLKKVHHHIVDNDAYLEKGNLSIYFSSDPQVKKIENLTAVLGNEKEESFFFPYVMIADEYESIIQRINNYIGDYKVTIKTVVEPELGIMITFLFDPTKLALHYETFDSIGMQKGIVFHLYNKTLIEALEQKNNRPILRMLSNEHKPCIVIDAGHGGIDYGAIGCNSVYEKSVCLAIGQNVADLLRQNGCCVLLTRDDDTTLLLEERTLFANRHTADLFVSIHANYAVNSSACGIETFCLQQQLFKEQFSTLSLEQKKNVVQYVCDKIAVSNRIAVSIQNYLCGDHYVDDALFTKPVDRKVKFSVSQVLLGTQMPSVLIEVGFLSHPKEVQLLNSTSYQNFLAQRIVNGIIAVLNV